MNASSTSVPTSNRCVPTQDAQPPRQRADPLPNRDLRDHLFDQVRRGVRPYVDQGQISERILGVPVKCDKSLEAAAPQRRLRRPLLQAAAAKVSIDLAHDEFGQAADLLGSLHEPQATTSTVRSSASTSAGGARTPRPGPGREAASIEPWAGAPREDRSNLCREAFLDDGGALYSLVWVPAGAHRRRRRPASKASVTFETSSGSSSREVAR